MSRPLDPADDATLFIGVTFGKEPWSLEVERFLRSRAVKLEEREECWTTVFLLPGKDKFVGFYTTRTIKLNVNDKFRDAFEISKTKARGMPVQVDACYLVAFGVNVEFQNQRYASEIHWGLVESLTTGPLRPPFVFLKVWVDNDRAAWLYHDWEYKTIEEELATRSTDGVELPRWLMVLKVRD
jgi:ribosomal protein S18 acetylase RimI-like enzyme